MNRLSINIAFAILRVLLPIIGIGYLAIESREIFALRQLTSYTVFVALFMMANFQMSVSRALIWTTKRKAAFQAAQIGAIMFTGTLFAAIDAALETFFSQLDIYPNTPSILLLFLLGWLCNSAAIIFALISMHRFIPLLNDLIQASTKKLDPGKTEEI